MEGLFCAFLANSKKNILKTFSPIRLWWKKTILFIENREFAELFFARSYRHEQAQSLRLSLKRVSLILSMKSRQFQPKRIRRTLTSVGMQVPATVRYAGRPCAVLLCVSAFMGRGLFVLIWVGCREPHAVRTFNSTPFFVR